MESWPDKQGNVNQSYKWDGNDDCMHEISIVIDCNGNVRKEHVKKDRDGVVTRLDNQLGYYPYPLPPAMPPVIDQGGPSYGGIIGDAINADNSG